MGTIAETGDARTCLDFEQVVCGGQLIEHAVQPVQHVHDLEGRQPRGVVSKSDDVRKEDGDGRVVARLDSLA